MTYDKNFIHKCEQLYHMMKQNRSLKECLNAYEEIASSTNNNIYEPLWFIYYMFFAIHNPKLEEYIQKKTQHNPQHNPQIPHIIKNMIKRRNYTSTIVFQLYTHAYTNDGNVTYIYPKDKDNALIKSYQSNHLKTTAVHLRRHAATAATATAAVIAFVECMMTTKSIYSSITTPTDVINKINKNINYNNKDVILLALLCYMKLDEEDINQKNIFIAATTEEMNQKHDATTPIASNEPEIPSTSAYDKKYKYLYT
jgi:hypothetical protein